MTLEKFDIEKFIRESVIKLDKNPEKRIERQKVHVSDSVNTSAIKTGFEHINERYQS